jgi:hypothetical protein
MRSADHPPACFGSQRTCRELPRRGLDFDTRHGQGRRPEALADPRQWLRHSSKRLDIVSALNLTLVESRLAYSCRTLHYIQTGILL